MNHNITSVKGLLESVLNIEDDKELLERLKQVSFRLKYNDPVLKGELTPPYLATLNDYQESIYFAYLALNGKKEDLRYLTNEEKDALSLKFKIEEGSDIIDIMSENSDKLIDLIGDKMDGTQILISIVVLLGYLSLDKVKDIITEINNAKKDQLSIDRETKLYDTIENIADKIVDSTFMEKREEAIEKPLLAYEGNELVTDEFKIKSSELKTEKHKKVKEEMIIEGEFLVDGMTGMSGDKRTFYLMSGNEKYSVQLRRSELDILNTEQLLRALGKFIKAKLIIKKVNGVITKKIIENVEIISNEEGENPHE